MICGQCGDQVFFRLHDGLLGIFGTGPMWDFKPEKPTAEQQMTFYDTPWRDVMVHRAVVFSGVTRIGNGAFCKTSLQLVHLPDTLTEIGSWAFADTKLEHVGIPSGVHSIGTHAFFRCACLQELLLPETIRIGSYSFAKTGMRWLRFQGPLLSAGKMAFWYNPNLTKLKLPQCGSLGYGVFDSCGLTQVDLSECGLEHLPDYMFSCCEQLKTVFLPPHVQTLGTGSFMSTGLTELVVPEGVTAFHPGDVVGSDKLKRIVFLGKAPECNVYSSFSQEDLELVVTKNAEGFDVMPWRGRQIIRLTEEEMRKLVKKEP